MNVLSATRRIGFLVFPSSTHFDLGVRLVQKSVLVAAIQREIQRHDFSSSVPRGGSLDSGKEKPEAKLALQIFEVQ
jgi:hypothetical protein